MSVQCDDIKSNWVIAGIIPYTALGPFIKRERKMFLDVAALKYHLFASRAEVFIYHRGVKRDNLTFVMPQFGYSSWCQRYRWRL